VKDDYKILTPLHKIYKRGTSGAKWKQAYQAVKHNRAKNLPEGNIGNLIKAMAALYLLNIYYKNEKFNLSKGFAGSSQITKDFDVSLGSDIFSVKTPPYISFEENGSGCCLPNNHQEYVYFEKYSDGSYKEIIKKSKEAAEKQTMILKKSPEFNNYLKNNPYCSFENKLIYQVAEEAGGEKLKQQIFLAEMDKFRLYEHSSREVVLNKNQIVYPANN
jgi:hypothetical protein